MILLKPNFNPDPDTTGGTPPAENVETTEFQTLSTKDATTLTDPEKARLTELQTKFDVVMKDDKGNPLTPEQVTANKELEVKFNTILAKPEDQRTPEEIKFIEENTEAPPAKSIYEEVEAITGRTYQIDYEGIEPLSAEGIARREQVIEEQAARNFETQIKTKYGRAYQLMLHLSQGGKEEDFFKPENQNFLELSVKKDDPAQQERILRTALATKGNSPVIIDAVIAALKDGQMYETAKSELEALQGGQKQREQQREQLAEQKRVKEEQEINVFSDQLDTAVTKGFDGIVIPAQDQKKFQDFIYDQLDYFNGSFIMTKKVDPKELNKVLKAAYFEFKGGDLKGLIDRSAATKNALKFKSNMKQEIVPKGTSAPARKYVPMGGV